MMPCETRQATPARQVAEAGLAWSSRLEGALREKGSPGVDAGNADWEVLVAMEIRDDQAKDADEIADLFHDSVHAIVSPEYSAAELEAWAPTPTDYSRWRAAVADNKKRYLACREGMIIGFIELEDDGHIDCFYTHKDFQRQGVGRALYAHLVAQAAIRGIANFYVEASSIARPFFEREGFRLVKENRIERFGQILTNYSMSLKR